MSKTINFAEWKKQQAEQHTLVIDLEEGRTLTVPPMVLWPRPLEDEDGKPNEQNEAYMRRICGDEAYQTYLDEGGTFNMLDAMVKDALGLNSGKSDASSQS